jgi:glucokinase
MVVAAIDVGGTKIASALFHSDGSILHRTTALLQGRQGSAVAELIIEQLSALRTKSKEPIHSVGLCIPGIYYAESGTVWAPNIPGWDRYPLKAEIEQTVNSQCPVVIDSDRACYILGETWQGAARHCANAIFLAVGTGIGAGILVQGQILRGAGDAAGAIGWLALDLPFKSHYKECGCFEYHASGPGLVKVALEKLQTNPDYRGRLLTDPLTTADLFAAYKAKDPVAMQVLEEATDYWAMAVANLVSLFNPEAIIFGGGLFGPAAEFLPAIYNKACQWAQPISIKKVRLLVSALGADAGLWGAANLALQPAGPVKNVVHPS